MTTILLLQATPQPVPYTVAAMPGQMANASLATPGAGYPQQPALVPLVPLQGTPGSSMPIPWPLSLTGRSSGHHV